MTGVELAPGANGAPIRDKSGIDTELAIGVLGMDTVLIKTEVSHCGRCTAAKCASSGVTSRTMRLLVSFSDIRALAAAIVFSSVSRGVVL